MDDHDAARALGGERESAPPESAAPESAAPDTAAPDTAAPDTAAPDTAAPDTAAPDTGSPLTTDPRPPWGGRLARLAGALIAVVLLALAGLIWDGWTGFGQRAVGARAARMRASPEWHEGVFENPQPLWNDLSGSFGSMLNRSPVTTPDAPGGKGPVPVVTSDGTQLAIPSASGLRVTWLGHSSTFVELDGLRVLTDPIFDERASPWTWLGPKRWYPPPIPLAAFEPLVDAVIISHDHYDHLQEGTIAKLKDWPVTFIAPLGVGAHLEYWGVPAARIVELDWWQTVELKGITIACTPARHASGRHLFDQNATLWSSYALVGPQHRVWFSGDTGYFDALKEIGRRFGPFDLTLLEDGAYDPAWPDWHIGPEQAIRAHQDLGGRVLLPIHWGLWSLAGHGWTEPIERILLAARAAGVTVVAPHPGQSVEPTAGLPLVRWWPELPFLPAAERPIISTRNGDPRERL